MHLSPRSILGSRLEEPRRTMLARSRPQACQASALRLQLVSRVWPQRSRPWLASIRLSQGPTRFQSAVVRIHSNLEHQLFTTGNLILLSLLLVSSVSLLLRRRLLLHIPTPLFGKGSWGNLRSASYCIAMLVQTNRDLFTMIWRLSVEK